MTDAQSAALTQAMLDHAARQNMLAWIWGTVVVILLIAALIHAVRR